MEKTPGSEQSLEKPVGIWDGSGDSELQSPQEATKESSLAPPLLLISCVIFGKLLTLSES